MNDHLHVTPETLHALLTSHISDEEDMFRRGEERMRAIEGELAPLKKMYWAVIGSAGVGSILLTLLVSFYAADRSEMKELSKAVLAQGLVLERIVTEIGNMKRIDDEGRKAIESLRDQLTGHEINQAKRKP